MCSNDHDLATRRHNSGFKVALTGVDLFGFATAILFEVAGCVGLELSGLETSLIEYVN